MGAQKLMDGKDSFTKVVQLKLDEQDEALTLNEVSVQSHALSSILYLFLLFF